MDDSYLHKMIYIGVRESLRQRWAYAYASCIDGHCILTERGLLCPKDELKLMIDRVAKRVAKRRFIESVKG